VRFRKQSTCFQAPRLTRAFLSTYFYLLASLILAKADRRPVVQGRSFQGFIPYFCYGRSFIEPVPSQWSPVGDIWLIVDSWSGSAVFLGFPFSFKQLFSLSVVLLVVPVSVPVGGSIRLFGFGCSLVPAVSVVPVCGSCR
jgi:hypothetical protein